MPPSFYTLRTAVRRTIGATSVEMGFQQGSSHIVQNDADVRGCSLDCCETRGRESGVLGPAAPPAVGRNFVFILMQRLDAIAHSVCRIASRAKENIWKENVETRYDD